MAGAEQLDMEMQQKGKDLIEKVGLEHVPGNKGCNVMADADFTLVGSV